MICTMMTWKYVSESKVFITIIKIIQTGVENYILKYYSYGNQGGNIWRDKE